MAQYFCEFFEETRISDCQLAVSSLITIPEIIAGCPHSWRMFDGYCYKFINSKQKKTVALQMCQQEKHGSIVSPAESDAETNLLRKVA